MLSVLWFAVCIFEHLLPVQVCLIKMGNGNIEMNMETNQVADHESIHST